MLDALADLILVVHALFIVFVVMGWMLTVIGGFLGWQWILNAWFRCVHLACIGVVVLQSWVGVVCPLTSWENDLRLAAGEPAYEIGFIATWLHRLIFLHAPVWAFTLAYTLFGFAVLATWMWRPPHFGVSNADV